MKPAFHRIICDNPACDHKENIDISAMPSFIGKPCPNCGENLLTDSDFDNHLILLGIIDAIPEPVEKSGKLTMFNVHGGKLHTAPVEG